MCPFNNTTATVVNFPLLQPMQQDNQEVAAMGKLCKGVAPVGVVHLSVKHDRLAVDSLHTNTMGNLQQSACLPNL